MIRRINIIDKTDNVLVSTWAVVDGNIAIHKSYMGGGLFARGNQWSITHDPTGALLTGGSENIERGDLKSEIDKLKSTGVWDFFDRDACSAGALLVAALVELWPDDSRRIAGAVETADAINRLVCNGE